MNFSTGLISPQARQQRLFAVREDLSSCRTDLGSAQHPQGVTTALAPPAPAQHQLTGWGSDEETLLHTQMCTPHAPPGPFTTEKALSRLGSQSTAPVVSCTLFGRQGVSWEACQGRGKRGLFSINPEEAVS